VRPRDPLARVPLVSEIVGDALARSIRPTPLSTEATARLVSEGLGESADKAFSTACHTATDGNPLLLRELISTLQIEGVAPDRGHISAVRQLGPRAVSRAVLVRLARLGDDALRLARAASVLQGGVDFALLAALAEVDHGDAAPAVSDLIAAEILADDPALTFVHPLVGAAVYEDMPALERSLAHERAAHLLRGAGPRPVRSPFISPWRRRTANRGTARSSRSPRGRRFAQDHRRARPGFWRERWSGHSHGSIVPGCCWSSATQRRCSTRRLRSSISPRRSSSAMTSPCAARPP
jgi:hypothetical protein